MSKTIINNNLLRNEIKALYNYVDRDEYNLNVVETMINEIQDIVKGLKPCEKVNNSYDKGIEDYLKKVSGEHSLTQCPYCGSINNIESLYGSHYLCENCHKEFDV